MNEQMISIRIYYRNGQTETIDVTDYHTSNGWLTYTSYRDGRRQSSIPADIIQRVELV